MSPKNPWASSCTRFEPLIVARLKLFDESKKVSDIISFSLPFKECFSSDLVETKASHTSTYHTNGIQNFTFYKFNVYEIHGSLQVLYEGVPLYVEVVHEPYLLFFLRYGYKYTTWMPLTFVCIYILSMITITDIIY